MPLWRIVSQLEGKSGDNCGYRAEKLQPILRPAGLFVFRLLTHGLRRGLHSYAASRLLSATAIHFFGGNWIASCAHVWGCEACLLV